MTQAAVGRAVAPGTGASGGVSDGDEDVPALPGRGDGLDEVDGEEPPRHAPPLHGTHNVTMHGETTQGVPLEASLRTATPLLRAALDRIVHALRQRPRPPASDQRSPAKRSFSGSPAPVASCTRTKVSMPINSPNLSLPILRKKMFSP